MRDRPWPISVDPASSSIAPSTIRVPLKTELSPNSKAPAICQYTLHKDAPFFKTIFVNVPVDNAPPILKINKALGSPCASKIKFPFIVEAPPVQ